MRDWSFRIPDGAGLAFGEDPKLGRCIWTRRKLRKSTACANCDEPLPKGTEAYGPSTNGSFRMDRLCVRCVRIELRAAP